MLGKLKRSPAPASATESKEPLVKGWFRANEQLISGWAFLADDPSRKVDVDLLVDGRRVGRARADRFDPAVKAQMGGDGMCAFAFYLPSIDGGWTEGDAFAVEASTGAPLKTKLPKLSAPAFAGPPLTITSVSPSLIQGRVGAYPRFKENLLEIWSGDKRIVSDIPISWTDRSSGEFVAKPSAQALSQIISGNAEAALPGLKEAGLSVPLLAEPPRATLRRIQDELAVEVQGFSAEGCNITVRFAEPDRPPLQIAATVQGGVATCDWPSGFDFIHGQVSVAIEGADIPCVFRQPVELKDPDFATLGEEGSPWEIGEDTAAERGFYAFPNMLATELSVSGDLARLTTDRSEGGLRLSQLTATRGSAGETLSASILARASRNARIAVRLSDGQGLIAESKSSGQGRKQWVPIRLEAPLTRSIEGDVLVEIEARGTGVQEMEIALGDTAADRTDAPAPRGANLLVNDGLEEWPDGAGVLRHGVKGEICKGWRLFNRKCEAPVWTRAVMDPESGSIGLAIAAPEVTRWLRLEADIANPLRSPQPAVLHFRAGITQAARNLLSQQTEAVPQFVLLSRAFLLRRIRTMTEQGPSEAESVGAVIARKVSLSWDLEHFSFEVPPVDFPERDPSEAADAEETYHLILEFRGPTVLAVHDVELLPAQAPVETVPEQLKVEDRNIQLQIPLVKTIRHWSSPNPVLPIATERSAGEPMKWSAGALREPVEIVIPVFNALDETLGCLESLATTTKVPSLVRLIDDGSEPHVLASLQAYAQDKPWIDVRSLGQNRGYTFASDFGIRGAETEWVVLLNSDTVATRGWLEGMLDCARSDPNIAMVGPLSNAATYQSVPNLRDATKKWKVNSLPAGMTAEDMAEIVRNASQKDYPDAPLLNGFCTLMKRSVYLEVGGLNYGAFPQGYGEENDLCIRVRKAGWRLAIADDVYVFHHKSASFGNARREQLSKKGSTALRKLHPDVDVGALTDWFRDIPALVAVRAGVASALEELGCNRDEGSEGPSAETGSETVGDAVAA